MKLIKELKGGSLSKTQVIQSERGFFVRKKISISREREYGLVRWQSQIRKLQTLYNYLPDNTLPIINMGCENDSYFFDIPYLQNSDNLYEALKKGISPKLITKKVLDIIKLMTQKKYISNKGSLQVYIIEEIKRPILKALDANELNKLKLSEKEKNILQQKLINSLKKVDLLIDKFKETELFECLTHGNFTLENALWNYEKENIILIDPYGETYCETILGDISQLLQSSESGYEFISQLADNENFDIIEYPAPRIPNFLKVFSKELIVGIENEAWYLKDITLLLHASQFTRMFPFKLENNPRQGGLFINHGINLLESLSVKS